MSAVSEMKEMETPVLHQLYGRPSLNTEQNGSMNPQNVEGVDNNLNDGVRAV